MNSSNLPSTQQDAPAATDSSNLPPTQQDAPAATFKMQAAYRVETALSNRAACQATECKNAGIKIDKHELRLGVWVDFYEHGSWMWRHWGCVTGKQLQNIREYMADPEKPGEYLWDKLDGYEGEEHNCLDKSPDLQEKVKRAITQGFIDPDDFNGDPEMNVLGAIGLRSAASKKKMRQDKITGANEIQELRAQLAAVTAERDELRQIVAQLQIQYGRVNIGMNGPASSLNGMAFSMNGVNKKPTAKRSLVDDASDYEEDKKPAKRRATKKVPKQEVDEMDGEPDEAAMIAATKKPRTKRVAKKETDIIKLEDGIEAPPAAPVAPRRKRAARGKKAVKEESANEGNVVDGGETLKGADTSIASSNLVNAGAEVKTEAFDDVPMTAVAESSSLSSLGGSLANSVLQETNGVVRGEHSNAPFSLTEKSSTDAFGDMEENPVVKKEYVEALGLNEADSQNNTTAAEVFGNGESYIPGVKDADIEYAFTTALEAGEIENDWEGFLAKKKAEHDADPKKKRGGRSKKSAAPAAKGTRATRSRTKAEIN